jgi:hypothetical protein
MPNLEAAGKRRRALFERLRGERSIRDYLAWLAAQYSVYAEGALRGEDDGLSFDEWLHARCRRSIA